MACALAILGVVLVALFVDISPRVEGDFFFAEDDPQMIASRAVAERFPGGEQILLRVEDLADDTAAYREHIAALTDELLAIDGITGGFSITTDSPARSPLFRRLLLNPDSAATNIVLSADETDPQLLIPRIEAVINAHRSPELAIVMSGVPVIVELIRRSLYRDLIVFSLAAVAVFGLISGLLYRDAAIVVGTLATCFVSVSLTLIVGQLMGSGIGLLTANLVTIVFVLTLSHVVFLTANWTRAAAATPDRGAALQQGIRDTLEGSFWSMATTLLGFLSLLIATARPLRELGMAGAVGSLCALLVTYSAYPTFLGYWAKMPTASAGGGAVSPMRGRRGLVVGTVTAVVVLLGVNVFRVDTDPGLLTYFAEGTELRDGLELVDRDGGSSTLDIIVSDPDGGRIDAPAVFARMEVLQESLDADSAAGVVVSPTVLIGHARTLPLAGFLPVPTLLDLASSPQLGGVGLGFVTAERDQGHYLLRMRESHEEPSRQAVMDRMSGYARDAGLEPTLVAGLYDLQAQLGRLIQSSLRIGIGGLLVLFLGVALVVSRSFLTTLKMWLCLAAIPTVVLGTFGLFGIAVDIVTSPAANVALAIGADSMIHLVVRVRRLTGTTVAPWTTAVAQISRPVLIATGIISAGFGIFVLSSFPPTQRFGLAVILGTAAAATMALVVLPRLVATEATPEPSAAS
ncbi:MAG: MMPL family transporter [Gemmatimonadota bacterium]|nr:MMPL family transporter [Gemmatimonadota bacterium]MDH3422824.1 MMPL family transporter [Gemmatimonadota bacterium]